MAAEMLVWGLLAQLLQAAVRSEGRWLTLVVLEVGRLLLLTPRLRRTGQDAAADASRFLDDALLPVVGVVAIAGAAVAQSQQESCCGASQP